MLQRVGRGEGGLWVALVDIDHFKRINDTWWHPAGDAVLCETVRRLRAASRAYDLVSRYGGEEFLLLLPGEGGRPHLDRLLQAISETAFDLGEQGLRLAAATRRAPVRPRRAAGNLRPTSHSDAQAPAAAPFTPRASPSPCLRILR